MAARMQHKLLLIKKGAIKMAPFCFMTLGGLTSVDPYKLTAANRKPQATALVPYFFFRNLEAFGF
ncbi:MAG: hypothetical protein Aureis2KO_07350 [Aureisphaera sp.]